MCVCVCVDHVYVCYVIILQDHQYLDPPILSVQTVCVSSVNILTPNPPTPLTMYRTVSQVPQPLRLHAERGLWLFTVNLVDFPRGIFHPSRLSLNDVDRFLIPVDGFPFSRRSSSFWTCPIMCVPPDQLRRSIWISCARSSMVNK